VPFRCGATIQCKRSVLWYCLEHKFKSNLCSSGRIKKFETKMKDRAGNQNEWIGDLSVNLLIFKENIIFESHLIKSNLTVLRKD
jgi:hypothetical protein